MKEDSTLTKTHAFSFMVWDCGIEEFKSIVVIPMMLRIRIIRLRVLFDDDVMMKWYY